MKRFQLKQLIMEIVRTFLNELGNEAQKFFWLDPDGKLRQVPRIGHWDWGFHYLTKIKHIPEEEAGKNVYGLMAQNGFFRVVLHTYMGKKILQYDETNQYKPTARQRKSLSDYAIEFGADEVEAYNVERGT